jgi:hypothetical protein
VIQIKPLLPEEAVLMESLREDPYDIDFRLCEQMLVDLEARRLVEYSDGVYLLTAAGQNALVRAEAPVIAAQQKKIKEALARIDGELKTASGCEVRKLERQKKELSMMLDAYSGNVP